MPQADPMGRDRLAVAVDATPLLGTRSGVGMFCAGALEALAARSDLSVAAFAVTWRRRHLLRPLVPGPVRVVERSMPARPLHKIWAHFSVPPIEWFTGPVDVVHGTNFVVPPTRRAARVVTVHDLTAVHYPALCDASTRVFPEIVRRAVAEGAWVHTPSQFVADEAVAAFGVSPERVRVVYHGIPRHTSASASGRSRAGSVRLPSGTTRYVLALGTVEPRKDLPGLVRAFDVLAGDHGDVALVLAGAGGWGDDALERAMAQSPWRSRILGLGYVDDDALGQVLAGAAVLAYPSVYEGFGFPPLEAMAVGVPVVATAVGAIPEVVGDGALLVPPGDIDALAAGISDLLTDSDSDNDSQKRTGLIARGRARAALFTWEKCGQGLADLYSEAARAAASTAARRGR
ncbi:MAG TPA: glycosyltransferase family 1 protein [Acidimicrobiales bacterium]